MSEKEWIEMKRDQKSREEWTAQAERDQNTWHFSLSRGLRMPAPRRLLRGIDTSRRGTPECFAKALSSARQENERKSILLPSLPEKAAPRQSRITQQFAKRMSSVVSAPRDTQQGKHPADGSSLENSPAGRYSMRSLGQRRLSDARGTDLRIERNHRPSAADAGGNILRGGVQTGVTHRIRITGKISRV